MKRYIINIWNKLLGRKMPPQEDPRKILTKILELNSSYPPANWIALQGWNAITTVSYGYMGPVYNPYFGTPIKAFLNTNTGEIKTFDARKFFT